MGRHKKEFSVSNQTNGALPSKQSVYEIVGQQISPYNTDDIEQYRNYLDTLDLLELQNHAIEAANIVPIDDRNRLVDRLEKEFLRTQAKQPEGMKPMPPPSKEGIEMIKKIMSRAV